jgi:hypothetical protein
MSAVDRTQGKVGDNVFSRFKPRIEPWRPGYAVRRDWVTLGGSHEFIGFAMTRANAGWRAVADRAYWRRGPARPQHSVVEISMRDFVLHAGRRDCRSPDCPAGAPSMAVFEACAR